MRLLATLALALVQTTAVHAQVTFLDEVRIEDGLRVGDHAAPTALVDIIKNTTGGLSPFAITRTNGGNQNNRFRFSITGNSGGVAPGSLYLIADQNDGDFAVVTDQSSLDPQFLALMQREEELNKEPKSPGPEPVTESAIALAAATQLAQGCKPGHPRLYHF